MHFIYMVLRCLDKFKSLIHLFIHSEFQNVLYNNSYLLGFEVFIYLFKTWSDKCKGLLTQPDGHANTPSIDLPDEENIYALKVRVIASQVLWVLRQSYCVHNQRGDYDCEERMYTWLLSFTADILSEEEMYQLWIKDKILNSIASRIKWKLREK